MATLSELIAQAITEKQGNKEFALHFLPNPDRQKNLVGEVAREWRAAIGNTSLHVFLGESEGEIEEWADTAEAAVEKVIARLRQPKK